MFPLILDFTLSSKQKLNFYANRGMKKGSTPKGMDPYLGGLEGIRTLDPHNANVVRSQLRYKPKF